MMRIGYVVFCLAAMVGVWFACRFLITGISSQFGDGVAVGAGIVTAIYYFADKMERSRATKEPVGRG